MKFQFAIVLAIGSVSCQNPLPKRFFDLFSPDNLPQSAFKLYDRLIQPFITVTEAIQKDAINLPDNARKVSEALGDKAVELSEALRRVIKLLRETLFEPITLRKNFGQIIDEFLALLPNLSDLLDEDLKMVHLFPATTRLAKGLILSPLRVYRFIVDVISLSIRTAAGVITGSRASRIQ